jgi:hypothetical protein
MTLYWEESVLKPGRFSSNRTGEIHEARKRMSEQQSQKRGVRSEAQKTTSARDAYEPIPPANAVGGATGQQQKPRQTDKDLSYSLEEERLQKKRAEEDK